MTTLNEAYADAGLAKPKRKNDREHVLQIAVKQYLTTALPPAVLWTSVDKGQRHAGNNTLRIKMANKIKSRGVKNGVPDMHFWWSGIYLAVELKVGKNDTSDDQDKWIEGLRREGFRAEVAYTVTDVENALRSAGFPVRESARGIDERLPLREPPKVSTKAPKTIRSRRGLRAGFWAQRPK